MTRSSGQYETVGTGWRNCPNCEFAGIADWWADLEINEAGWVCPRCGGEHEEVLP